MSLYKDWDYSSDSPVRAAFDDLSDQRIHLQDPDIVQHVPSYPFHLQRGAELNATRVVTTRSREEVLADEAGIQHELKTLTMESHNSHAEAEDEAFIVDSPQYHLSQPVNTGIQATRKDEGLCAENLHKPAEDDAHPLGFGECISGQLTALELPDPSQAKNSHQINSHDVFTRPPRDVRVVPAGIMPAYASSATFKPKLISADLWYKSHCPEIKFPVQPQPLIPLSPAEVTDTTTPTSNVSDFASFSAINAPRANFAALESERKPVQSSTASHPALKITAGGAAKRAYQTSDSNTVTSDNNPALAIAFSEARAARATMRAEKRAARAKPRVIQRSSDQVITTAQVETPSKRHPDQDLFTSESTKTHKAATTKLTAPNLSLPPRPIISLKRKRGYKQPDDENSDLPFRWVWCYF